MKTIHVLLLLLLFRISVSAQINVELLHQLVAESKQENSGQNKARDRQAEVTATEDANRSKMQQLKVRYREIKERFHVVGLVLNAAQIGIEATPLIAEIAAQQEEMLNLAKENPLLIKIIFESEYDLIYRSRLLVNYLIGLILTIGDINQMKASDRRLLFGHVITELRLISGSSRGLLLCMKNASRKYSLVAIRRMAEDDRKKVDELIRKYKILKR